MTDAAGELRRILAEQTLDLRTLTAGGFRRWLAVQVEQWNRDPVFVQRVRIRNLRLSQPRLRDREDAHRRAVRADADGPHFTRLAEIDRELANANKAIAGLGAALEAAAPDDQPPLRGKRDAFHVRWSNLHAERAALIAASPERQALQSAVAELARFRGTIGLDREEARLTELLAHRGRHGGRSGVSFERVAEQLAREVIVPNLGTDRLRILRRVRLGAAGVELDLLIVRPSDDASQPVGVLAAVEAKRNINDVGHGFTHRQRDLAWLTGDRGGYDPAAYRTRTFPTGHFDRPATHHEDGDAVRFGPESFARFRRDPETGFFLDGFHLVTRPGWVWGASTAALARIATRVASDEAWDDANEAYLTGLLDWCRSLTGPVETPDVLRLFTGSPAHAHQLHVVRS